VSAASKGVSPNAAALIRAARSLSRESEEIRFSKPVRYVYNPLRYAWPTHAAYLTRFAGSSKRILLVGMNPGPWGMAQTGVPFGEVAAVRDWLQVTGKVGQPREWHERVPVTGFQCSRSEVSGRRLWGLLREHYGSAAEMAREMLVSNYCPLLFLDEAGKNLTPDKLASTDREALHALCDRFLRVVVESVRPQWALGIGRYAESRLRLLLPLLPAGLLVGSIPHPSPASPSANRDWASQARRVLEDSGIWERHWERQ
jgi:single-strand selective monofunctional uracil DNA glycosylase